MKKNYPVIILISVSELLFCGKGREKPGNPSEKKSWGIVLFRNSAIRIDPYVFSGRVDLLDKGEAVEIIGKSYEKGAVENSRDYWYRVKTSRQTAGWIFARNIKILTNITESGLDDFLTDFWEEESGQLKKDLAGKWWSVNAFGDFTDHGLEITEDGKYKSYLKGGGRLAEGDYSFDFKTNEVVLMKGSSFGANLNFSRRGKSIILEKMGKNLEIKFKKIVNETPSEEKAKDEDKAQ